MWRFLWYALIATWALLFILAWVNHQDGFHYNEHGWYFIDFAVFVWVLWRFGKKPISEFLQNRRETVKTEMDAAGKLKGEAEARLAKYEGLLSRLDQETTALREEFARDGERERIKILEDAKSSADKIKVDSERSMQMEAARVRDELEKEVAVLALKKAEDKIKAKLTPAVHANLVKQYIADLEDLQTLGDFRA